MPTRLLLVEDHEFVGDMLARLFKRQDDLTLAGLARSLAQARTWLETDTPDLVLADFSLPDGDGTELVRELAASHPDLPCLMVSGYKDPAHIKAAREAGARGYALKSEPQFILDAVRRVLEGDGFVELV